MSYHFVSVLCPYNNYCAHRYSYSMDELKCQLDQMAEYSDDYTVWRQKVHEVLSMKSSKPEYLVIRPLVKQGSRWLQPHCEPLCELQSLLEGAEMCSTVASQIVNIKCKTRYLCVYKHMDIISMHLIGTLVLSQHCP